MQQMVNNALILFSFALSFDTHSLNIFNAINKNENNIALFQWLYCNKTVTEKNQKITKIVQIVKVA